MTADPDTSAIAATLAAITARLDGMDRADVVLAETVNRVPTVLDREMGRNAQLTDQKFAGIQTQFAERDARRTQEREAASTAVAAALQAQKEAVSALNDANGAAVTKAEASTIKQIDALGALMSSEAKSTHEMIGNLASRLDRSEGGNARALTMLTLAIAAGGVLLALAGFALNHFR